jgi:DMSO/TMAO reductase YedYZ heme-binding membrane subunit
MKYYLTVIRTLQQGFLGASLVVLATLPLLIVFAPDWILPTSTELYHVAHAAVFFVMCIRPLADLMIGTRLVRPLVILRKGVGVFSASIVVSFLLAKVIVDPGGYFSSMGTVAYWSFENLALIAHLADITAVILLVTSNNFSKRILGGWWKRIQRLSYVYFYASALFVFLSYGDQSVLVYMIVVTLLTALAAIVNAFRRYQTSITSL